MAILFTEQLPQDTFIHAFNDVGVVFAANGGNPLKAEITIEDITITITPSPEGVFTYNFKRLFSHLLLIEGITDDVQPDFINNPNQFIYQYNQGNKEVVVNYTVIYDDESTEDVQHNYRINRSVIQLEDFKKGLDNSLNKRLSLLLPFVSNSIRNYWASYFQGYPFDISIWSNEDRSITIKNVKSQVQTTLTLTKGVNRLYFSYGPSNLSFNNIFPTYNGINDIEFLIDNEVVFTLHLMKYEIGCGEYIKWLNSQGGWAYHLFYNSKTQRQSRPFEPIVNNNFINNKESQQIGQGSEVTDEMRLFSSKVQSFEKIILNELPTSPILLRWLSDIYQPIDLKKWIEEQQNPFRQIIFQNKRTFWEVELELSKNKIQTIKP